MEPFPPPPSPSIDWDRLDGVFVHEVNGHVEADYSTATGQWTTLQFVTDPYPRVHGLSPALNYGQQALEGFKAFRGPSVHGSAGAITLFRPAKNATRFHTSAELLSMPAVPEALFVQACRTAVAHNAEFVPPHSSPGGLYVRPQLYGSSAAIVPSAAETYKFCVFVLPTGMPFGTAPVKALVVDEFDRAAPLGTGHAKIGGNYAPVVRWGTRAKVSGFHLTLHLDSSRHALIEEFGTCAFVGVRSYHDRVTVIVPDSPCIIDSVTSDTILHLARVNGWAVEKRPIPYTELPSFTEVLGAGTGVTLVPIRAIARRKPGEHCQTTGSGSQEDAGFETTQYLAADQEQGGPVYLKLLAQLRDVQTGITPDERGWSCEVRREDREMATVE